MAYQLGDFWIERTLFGMFFDMEGNPVYGLTQISDATIEITGNSEDITDKDGNVIAKRYTSKTGTFTANNAMLNVNILTSQTGTALERAIQSKAIEMKSQFTLGAGEKVVLTDIVADTIPKVLELWGNGATGDEVKQSTAASATEFGWDKSTKTLTLPTPTGDNPPTKYMVAYELESKDGLKIANYADVYPSKGELRLQVLVGDPCGDRNTYKTATIVIPSFQPSADASVATAADTKMEYKGDILPDYCSSDKAMYYIYFPNKVITTAATA